MITVVQGVHIVGIILSMWADQCSVGNDLSFVRVLLMLNMEECFILGILVAMAHKWWSHKLEIFRAYTKLKFSILEYDLLKPNLFSDALMLESMFRQLLEGRMNAIAFASHSSEIYITS